MIGLLQFAPTDLDNIGKIPTDLVQQLAANVTFAREQAVQWILVITTLLGERAEFL